MLGAVMNQSSLNRQKLKTRRHKKQAEKIDKGHMQDLMCQRVEYGLSPMASETLNFFQHGSAAVMSAASKETEVGRRGSKGRRGSTSWKVQCLCPMRLALSLVSAEDC